MSKGRKKRRAKRADEPRTPEPEPSTPTPLISLGALVRWLLPGMAVLLFVASWIRFAQVAANNRPPLRLVVMAGSEPWPQRELLRVRCGFNGQFLAVQDRVWIPCAPAAGRWELIRWDFARGMAERKWRAHHSSKDSSTVEVVQHQGMLLPPIIAAAVQLPGGDLALVLHGQKPLTPVELVIVRRKGGLAHHPLPGIKPGALAGFAYVDGRYELLTADCRRHVFVPGKPLVSAPQAGCPYDGKTVLEWSQRRKAGWRMAYSRQSKTPGRYALLLKEPGDPKVRPLGTLREATPRARGEKLDMSPGNVLPAAMSQWPTHALTGRTPTALESPPKTLTAGFTSVSPGGKQVFLLNKGGLRRLHMWHALSSTGAPGAQRAIRRWRWLAKLPTRWIGGESIGGQKTLQLVATAPDRTLKLTLPRPAPMVLAAVPARNGGTWLFDSQGRYLKVDDGLQRIDTPGLFDRSRRIWRLHHLQRNHLVGPPKNPEKQSRLKGWAHRASLPTVLLGLPVLLLLALPLARRAGGKSDPKRPLRASLTRPLWPWVVATTLYLLSAGALLWSFWQVTTAF